MNESTFWYSTWATIVSAIVIMFIALLIYQDHKKELIAEAIKSGADPMAVYCALDATSGAGDTAICQTIVLKDKQ